MGEFQMQSLGGSKRHMSVGSSAKTRNDANAVVKSAKISSTNKVSKGEAVYSPGSRSSGHVTDDASSCVAEANKENTSSQAPASSTVIHRRKKLPSPSVFGYDIDDINNFLSQATARTPANIPMVVTSRTELYVLAPAATPEDPTVPIRLGLVVNALFKHRQWLYVQTPHNQEGYLAYSACTPLGIIPRGSPTGPWENAGDAPPRRPKPVEQVSSAPQSDQEDHCRPRETERAPLRPLPAPIDSAQDSSDSAEGCDGPRQRRLADRPALKLPPGAEKKTSLETRVNKTDTEKMYENVTSDGRALGLLLDMHLRQGRGRHRSRARSQSAGREPGRRARSRPRRDASAPGDERPLAAPSDGLDRSQPSAFHPLRPCWPPAARSLEALRRAEVAPPRGGHLVAPRSNNKAVIWDGFTSRGRNTLTVKRGDIVILLNTSVGEWFWVKDALGREGYIPSVCVGSGLN